MTVFHAVKLLIIFTFFGSVLLHGPLEPSKRCKCDIEQFIPEIANKVRNTDLCVEYGDHKIVCGEAINLTTTIDVPKITYDLSRECNYATIVEIVPDSLPPSPYVVYLVHNVPVKNLKDGFRGQSADVPLEAALSNNTVGDYGARYQSPKTVTGGVFGDVNYLFFVYCQCQKIPKRKIKELLPVVGRGNFDLKGYAKKMQLRNPKAAIYYKYEPTGVPLPKVVDKPV